MKSFKRNIYKMGSASCTISPLTITTTDPTNINGDNGTATVDVSGIQGSITYSLNGGPFVPVVSAPFTITGLLASTAYTIVVRDSIEYGCERTSTFTLGETSFVFYADYLLVTYEFTDGRDLDTRTRIVSPDVGQDTQPEYLGWGVSYEWPPGMAYMTWGGDNTGTGFESALLDVKKLRELYPDTENLVIDYRSFWYGSVGTNPVSVSATFWKGGAPEKSGYVWINPSADEEFQINSTGTVVTLFTQNRTTSGQRVATLTYNLRTNEGVLNNNDSTTPEV